MAKHEISSESFVKLTHFLKEQKDPALSQYNLSTDLKFINKEDISECDCDKSFDAEGLIVLRTKDNKINIPIEIGKAIEHVKGSFNIIGYSVVDIEDLNRSIKYGKNWIDNI